MKTPTLQDVRNGIGGFVGGLGVLANVFLPAVPAMAQNAPHPTGQKLEAGKELTFTCIGVYPYKGSSSDARVTRVLDLDGNPNTKNDQVLSEPTLSWLRSNPSYILKIGDEVVAILSRDGVKRKFVYARDIYYVNGEMTQPVR